MRVIKFNPKTHFQPLLECLAARNEYLPTLGEMPKIGYVSIERNKAIAFAFLRRVEGGFAQIDGLTSNPTASPEQRHVGIDLAVVSILNKAKKLNLSHIIATSADESTILRSQKHGFEKLPLSIMAVDLTKRSPQ